MMNKPIFLFLLVCCCLPRLFAQETQVYKDPLSLYKEAEYFYNKKNYITARVYMDRFFSFDQNANPNLPLSIISDAAFIQAASALLLSQPDGEMLMKNYLKNYPETSRKNEAAYLTANYFFDQKQYNDAIEWYRKVEMHRLARADVEEMKFRHGYALFRNKDFDNAYRMLRDVKNVQNKNYHPANYYFGYIAFEKGKLQEAQESFETLRDSRMYGKVIPYYLCQIYFQQNEHQKLLEYATPILEDQTVKYWTEINHIVGQVHFSRQDYASALPYLENYVLGTSKVRKEDMYQLAFAQYQTGKCERAIPNLQQLSYTDDSLGQHAMYMLADCFLKQGDKQKARTAFFEASNRTHDDFIREHALLNYAKLSLELGFGNVAIASFQQFLEGYPGSSSVPQVKELLTDALFVSRNYKDALTIIESVKDQSPKNKGVYQKVAFYRGLELFNDRDYYPAKLTFNKALDHPIDRAIVAQTHFWKGEIYFAEGNYPEARKSYNAFVEMFQMAKPVSTRATLANAYYGLGYAWLKEEKYASALTYFEKARERENTNPNDGLNRQILSDITMRLADSYFMTRDYSRAIQSYQTVIDQKYPGSDYAAFQMGMIQGLQGNHEGKIQALTRLTTTYPNSNYTDDALFETGESYILTGKPQSAITTFARLVSHHPNSLLRPAAITKIGLLYYNEDNNAKALEYYRKVVEDYPKSQEAREALQGIKDISIDLGKPEIYISVLEKTPGLQVTASAQDSVSYLASESMFSKGNCDEAIRSFTKYLKDFPDGTFSLRAYFYRGECLFSKKDFRQALPDYEFVIARPRTIFTEKSLLRASEIQFYEMKNFATAIEYYQTLYDIASYKENTFAAALGLMRCGMELKRYEIVDRYGKIILATEQLGADHQIEANYFIGKAAFLENKREIAVLHLEETARLTRNAFGAEAKYLVAKLLFRDKKWEEAGQTALFVVNNFASYDEWAGKALVLLGAVYEAQDDLFQAKATLEGAVMLYSTFPEIVAEAETLLQKIKKKQENKSKILPDDSDPFNETE